MDPPPSRSPQVTFPCSPQNSCAEGHVAPIISTTSLENISLLDFLEYDPRPTFILNTANAISREALILPIHFNSVLTTVDSGRLVTAIMGQAKLGKCASHMLTAVSRFWNWAIDTERNPKKQFVYYGFSWIKALVAGQWTVISGSFSGMNDTSLPNHRVQTEKSAEGLSEINDSKSIGCELLSSFDWTGKAPPANITPHSAFARGIDWAHTPLGPMSAWSPQLRSIANLVMQDPRPAVMFWGPEVVMIYNSAYVELLGELHPGCMGLSARIGLGEVWGQFESIITRNMAGESVEETNTPVFLSRSGFLEETYFSLKFIPILDDRGFTVGHYEAVIETTREQVSQRRLSIHLKLSENIPRARDSKSYWNLATEVLSHNDKDIPFALLYSVEYDDVASSSSKSNLTQRGQGYRECILQGSIGVVRGSTAAPASLNFQENCGFMPYFRHAMQSQNPITIELEQGSPAAELVEGIQWQGFGDPCKAAAICPINPTSFDDSVLGFLVIGLNPRRPYDDDYRQFILLANRLLSTSLMSILLHEEDIGRRERAIARAESMKIQLTEQLLTTQQEVERNSLKFQRFAERADIGIFIVGLDGIYSYRNDAWYGIFQPENREMALGDSWEELIVDEYASIGKEKFRQVIDGKQHQSFELCLKRIWNVPSSTCKVSITEQQPMWVLCSVFPELSVDGDVLEIVGCVTDISRQKWGEKVQSARASDAQESKRQLENFIDSTSHEMRNPLSAIIHCADGIISTHKAQKLSTEFQSILPDILDSGIDAAETILQCSQHMKCIVDDVLTMSKLDSGLLIMTPVDVQVELIARRAVKMFEGEAKSAAIDLDFELEESYYELSIDWVSLDPTRLLQILINLITNAIKFTRLEPTRRILVSMGLSFARPLHRENGNVPYIQVLETAEVQSLQADWMKGDIIYINFTVKDTGRGVSESEKELLFARFSQASPRTHIHYGGSGLGLFISRRLTEMHGGAIGFTSSTGSGSTFSFYIKGRKSQISAQETEQRAPIAQILPTEESSPSQHSTDRKHETHTVNQTRRPSTNENSVLQVLIVEDNLVNQRVLAKQLRNLGMEVAVANHGGEALEYIRGTKYCTEGKNTGDDLSLILMDWEMPVMDGLTCVRNIRQLQKIGVIRGHVPVIAITANVRSEQVEVAIEAGMDDVVSKPFRVPELCERMRKLVTSK